MSGIVYMDNAATMRVQPWVLDAMQPYLCEEYGNPASKYMFSEKIADHVTDARNYIGRSIGAGWDEIYFTGSGSESDNWAIRGVADALRYKGNHIITTSIEHCAVLRSCEFLERYGFDVTYLPVDSKGLVDLNELENAIRPSTILISVMLANNEIGTIEPVAEIGRIAHEHSIYFHTDAVQAYENIPINVDDMNIDLLSASAHKMGGPKGIGFLYIREGINISGLIKGEGQEHGKRAGTLNVAGIMGFAKAVEIVDGNISERISTMQTLRNRLINRVLAEIPYSRLNGDREKRLANNASFCFAFVDSKPLLSLLDNKGICASSGAPLTYGRHDVSHVLKAIGLTEKAARSSLRLTLSAETTEEEVDYVVEALKQIVTGLRDVSPQYKAYVNKQK